MVYRFLFIAVSVCLVVPDVGRAAEPRAGLSLSEFQELHQALQPPRGEAWRELPWQTSILEAVSLAAREKKPLYMLVRSGHPLGCV
jgi:hypothetical protein